MFQQQRITAKQYLLLITTSLYDCDFLVVLNKGFTINYLSYFIRELNKKPDAPDAERGSSSSTERFWEKHNVGVECPSLPPVLSFTFYLKLLFIL